LIPLRDNIRPHRWPLVNYLLIAASGAVFAWQLGESARDKQGLVERFGMIPARVLDPEARVEIVETVRVRGLFGERLVQRRRAAESPPFDSWLTLLTCIFLHGGWMHFLGNMWFLFIFGDNVEDRLGHAGYLIFYLGSGVAASAAHLFTNAESTIPTVGASGAIAGVMGAYFLLYPKATVLTLVPLFYFYEMVVLPAPLFLGIWFVIQFFQGTLTITASATSGVAWWAHIGGFAVGAAVVLLLKLAGLLHRDPVDLRSRPARSRRYYVHRPR
jgi:membrane associated rhomboid family serine protease